MDYIAEFSLVDFKKWLTSLEMSFKLETCYAPHPTPTRAVGFFMTYNDPTDRFLYCIDNLVYIHGLKNQLDCDIYYNHSGKTTCASYSPNGRWIASADEMGNVKIWTPQNSEKTLQLETRPISGPVYDITWTGDNVRISVIGHGQNNAYGCVINAETAAAMGEVMGHTKPVSTGCLKPTRPFRFVSAGDDATHVFYKGPPFKFEHTTRDHERFVLCARYAPNGNIFATVGLDGKMIIYEGLTGEKKFEKSYGSGISTIAFSPDSTQALISLLEGRSLVVSVEDGSIIEEYKIGSEIYQQQCGALWTPKHKMTISLNGDFNFLENGQIRIERGHTSAIEAFCFIPGGFASGDSRGTVLFRKFDQSPYAVWNPDGSFPSIKTMCTMENDKLLLVGCSDKNLYILNIEDGSFVTKIEVGKVIRSFISLGNDVLIHADNSIFLLKEKSLIDFPTPEKVSSFALHPNKSELVIGDKSGHLTFISLDGTILGKVKSHDNDICTISYSQDGTKVASSSIKNDITVWSRDNLNEPLHEGWRFHSLQINKILFTNDGNHLITVSGDRSIRQWSLLSKRKYVEEKRAHHQTIIDAKWIDENNFLTIGGDGAIRKWSVTLI